MRISPVKSKNLKLCNYSIWRVAFVLVVPYVVSVGQDYLPETLLEFLMNSVSNEDSGDIKTKGPMVAMRTGLSRSSFRPVGVERQ